MNEQLNTKPAVDEFDQAMTDAPRAFHGQVTTEAYKVVLKKGEKPRPYDANADKGESTATMVAIHIAPLDPTKKFIDRNAVSFAAEFRQVIRPSIEALAPKIAAIRGVDVSTINPLREINQLWIAGRFVPRPDNKPGQTWTTIEFVDVFATSAECEAHAQATANGNGNGHEPPAAPAPAQATADPQRSALAAFIPALWAQAGKSRDAFAALLKSNPMLATFTLDSPEVKAVIG